MLNNLAGYDGVKMSVRVGVAVEFGVKEVDFAGEDRVWKIDFLPVHLPQRPEVGPADLVVMAEPLEKRRDLHVAAELQDSAGGLWRGDKSESTRQPWHMPV
jgi:hypothetical protein